MRSGARDLRVHSAPGFPRALCQREGLEDASLRRKPRRENESACRYAFNVSRNLTGSPVDGVITSPCHITRLPRTKVPTGQPVTVTPS